MLTKWFNTRFLEFLYPQEEYHIFQKEGDIPYSYFSAQYSFFQFLHLIASSLYEMSLLIDQVIIVAFVITIKIVIDYELIIINVVGFSTSG